ncbi:MAG: UDP-N-acetyl glucosamine 2-epimerase [Prevotella sp.]|nr:UDP-N-acetyl glucosamine 2-epimerase [Prevotella sp.]
MNICIIVGARPNFVKVAPLVWAIDKQPEASYALVYAGCDDDPTLESTLFSDLQMPRPDFFLGVDSPRLNEITAQVMGRFDDYLEHHPTDVVIVVDDLASTMAAAITAKKRGIRLAHLVAGTRSFDINMPKEINRLVIDALSDLLFTAGVKSNSVATREQQSETSQTYLVGNILMDTLRRNRDRLRQPAIEGLSALESQPYLVLTLNRKALLNDKDALQRTIATVLQTGMPVIAPLRGLASQVLAGIVPQHPMLHVVKPLSYLEFGWLTAHAAGIVTDSGNVAEEATFNGVPCLTLNTYTEHQETVTVGTNELVGSDAERLAACLEKIKLGQWKTGALPDRWDGRTADRIVQILATTIQ